MKLIGINEAEKFKQKVLDQRELLVRKPNIESSSNDKDESLAVLREIRDLLKDIKAEK